MGKEKDIADKIEDVLGLNEDNNTNDSTEDKKEDSDTKNISGSDTEAKKEDAAEQDNKNQKETSKEEKTKDTNTVTLTNEQVKINNEIAKIDTKLEDFEKNSNVDTDKFYDNLEDYLSEDEQQLEFDDKKAYLKLVKEKETEYVKSNSKEEEIKKLKDEKQNLERVFARQEGIKEVTAKYPDFNYESVMEHFENKLNKEEQEEVFKGAESYADVYENTYKMMNNRNTKEVKSNPAPDIPNVNNVRKESASSNKLKDGLKTDDEELQEALGL